MRPFIHQLQLPVGGCWPNARPGKSLCAVCPRENLLWHEPLRQRDQATVRGKYCGRNEPAILIFERHCPEAIAVLQLEHLTAFSSHLKLQLGSCHILCQRSNFAHQHHYISKASNNPCFDSVCGNTVTITALQPLRYEFLCMSTDCTLKAAAPDQFGMQTVVEALLLGRDHAGPLTLDLLCFAGDRQASGHA